MDADAGPINPGVFEQVPCSGHGLRIVIYTDDSQVGACRQLVCQPSFAESENQAIPISNSCFLENLVGACG